MKVVRVGIIGSGYMGKTFASVIKNIKEAKLIAISGGTRALSLAREFNVEYVTSWEELVKRDSIDAVIIATPHVYHAQQTIMAAENGKHVLVEKPMAITTKECEEMIRIAKKNNVKLMVAHSHRYWPANRKVKEIIDSGELGKIIAIRDTIIGGSMREAVKGKKSWIIDPKIAGGGALLFNGIHLIDRDRWWLGREVKKVFAQVGSWFIQDLKVEDTAVVHLLFEDNIPGDVYVSMGAPMGYIQAEIICERGLIIVNTYKEVKVCKDDAWITIYEVKDSASERVKTFTTELYDFIKAILHDEEPPIPGEEGLINVKIVEAAYESSRTGRVIELG